VNGAPGWWGRPGSSRLSNTCLACRASPGVGGTAPEGGTAERSSPRSRGHSAPPARAAVEVLARGLVELPTRPAAAVLHQQQRREARSGRVRAGPRARVGGPPRWKMSCSTPRRGRAARKPMGVERAHRSLLSPGCAAGARGRLRISCKPAPGITTASENTDACAAAGSAVVRRCERP